MCDAGRSVFYNRPAYTVPSEGEHELNNVGASGQCPLIKYSRSYKKESAGPVRVVVSQGVGGGYGEAGKGRSVGSGERGVAKIFLVDCRGAAGS